MKYSFYGKITDQKANIIYSSKFSIIDGLYYEYYILSLSLFLIFVDIIY